VQLLVSRSRPSSDREDEKPLKVEFWLAPANPALPAVRSVVGCCLRHGGASNVILTSSKGLLS
jgi:hypothetical protein